jgi:hypothetical protein
MREVIDLLESEKPLTNFDIVKICRYLNIPLDGVYMNNEFKYNWLNENFGVVLNLENTDMTGSHWVAFYNDVSTNSIYYFDSYGEVCNQKPYNLILKKQLNLYFNKKQFQAIESIMCGWFCIYFLYSMNKSKNKIEGFVNFLKNFNYSDYNKNDTIIKQKLSAIIKKIIKS